MGYRVLRQTPDLSSHVIKIKLGDPLLKGKEVSILPLRQGILTHVEGTMLNINSNVT